ncbi:MAG: flagellar brake protein [Candidatus Sumerlaeota bacterium]
MTEQLKATDPLNILREEQALALLDQACAERVALHLRLPDDPHVYDTAIDDLDASQGTIRIYTMDDGDVDRRMEPGCEVGVLLRVDGLPYRFAVRVSPGSRGIHHHLLEIPSQIEAVQRRSSVRIAPPREDSVTVQAAWGESETLLLVDIMDLSLGGALLRLPPGTREIEPEMPAKIQLSFPDDKAMLFEAKFCRVIPESKNHDCPAVGVRFTDMRPAREMELGRILMTWQRENRRMQS